MSALAGVDVLTEPTAPMASAESAMAIFEKLPTASFASTSTHYFFSAGP
jgi:hypothetical protein